MKARAILTNAGQANAATVKYEISRMHMLACHASQDKISMTNSWEVTVSFVLHFLLQGDEGYADTVECAESLAKVRMAFTFMLLSLTNIFTIYITLHSSGLFS